jgi:hypothetical protein
MGTCTCDATMCGAECVNTNTDAMNCGMCGTACAMGEACRGGTCRMR